jgi:DNA-binding GntR family transcriptional regulator
MYIVGKGQGAKGFCDCSYDGKLCGQGEPTGDFRCVRSRRPVGRSELTEYTTKVDLAVQLLRELIASGEIPPGETLRQHHLQDRVAMSATPVREALRHLEAEGLVVRIPHKGVRVAEIDPPQTAELYVIRSVLEGLAVEYATPRLAEGDLQWLERTLNRLDTGTTQRRTGVLAKLNYDFHTRIYRASGLPHLNRVIDSLWPLFPKDSMTAVPGRGDAIAHEHWAILDSLRRRDARRAGDAMRVHLEKGAEALLAFRYGIEPGSGLAELPALLEAQPSPKGDKAPASGGPAVGASDSRVRAFDRMARPREAGGSGGP